MNEKNIDEYQATQIKADKIKMWVETIAYGNAEDIIKWDQRLVIQAYNLGFDDGYTQRAEGL